MHIYLQIVKEMLLLDARMELAQKLDGRCPSFDSSPLSLRATSLGGKFSAAIWSAGGVPRITNCTIDESKKSSSSSTDGTRTSYISNLQGPATVRDLT